MQRSIYGNAELLFFRVLFRSLSTKKCNVSLFLAVARADLNSYGTAGRQANGSLPDGHATVGVEAQQDKNKNRKRQERRAAIAEEG